MRRNTNAGVILIILGILFLLRDYIPLRDIIKSLWPFILIVVGIYLLLPENTFRSFNSNNNNNESSNSGNNEANNNEDNNDAEQGGSDKTE